MSGPDTMAAPPPPATPDIQAGPPPVEAGVSSLIEGPKPSEGADAQQIALSQRAEQSVKTGDPAPHDLVTELAHAAPPIDTNAGDATASVTREPYDPFAEEDARDAAAAEQSAASVATESTNAQPLSPEQRQQQEVIDAQDAIMDRWTQDYLSQNGFSSITDMDTAAYDSFIDQQGKYVISQRFRGELATELSRRRVAAEQQAEGTPPAETQGGPVDQDTVAGEEQQPAEGADTDAEAAEEPATAAEEPSAEDAAEPEQTPEQKQIKELQEQLAASNAKIDRLANQLTASTENINKVMEQLAAANKTIKDMEVMIAKLGKALETDDLKLRKTTAKDVGLAILALMGKEAYDALMDSVNQQVAAAQPH